MKDIEDELVEQLRAQQVLIARLMQMLAAAGPVDRKGLLELHISATGVTALQGETTLLVLGFDRTIRNPETFFDWRAICEELIDAGVAASVRTVYRVDLERVSYDDVSPQGPDVSPAELRMTWASLNLASSIATRVREQASDEWSGEISASQAGEVGSRVGRLRFSADLVRAAVRIRTARMAAPVVAGLDRIIRSERKTRRAICLVMTSLVLYVFHGQGLAGIIADGESLIAIGGLLYAGARWRRTVLKERDAIAGITDDGG